MYLFLYEESRAHVLFMVKVVYPMCPMGSKSPQGGLVSRRGTRISLRPVLTVSLSLSQNWVSYFAGQGQGELLLPHLTVSANYILKTSINQSNFM